MKTKIILFGCQEIAVNVIDYLLSLDFIDLPLILTYELPLDKTYGYKSVLEKFIKRGLNVIMPKMITPEVIQTIIDIQPDLILSVYYRKILPKKIIDIPKIGCVNIHPGKLPYYRGPVPTAWAIQKGENIFGITIHNVDEGVDTGDILVQNEYPIEDDDTGYSLYTRAMTLGAEMIKENLDDIIAQKITPVPQKGIGSYYGKINGKQMINWKQKSEDIRNLIRVHAKPYSPAETILYNHYVLINKARVIRDEKYPAQGAGKIVDILDNEKIVVSCAEGCLLLEEYEIVPQLRDEHRPIYLKIGNKFD